MHSLSPGTLVRVPLGSRDVLGVVWTEGTTPPPNVDPGQLRPIAEVLPLPALDADWRRLIAFTASYYQRSLGEIALAALPAMLRGSTAESLTRRLGKLAPAPTRGDAAPQACAGHSDGLHQDPRSLHPEQLGALQLLAQADRPMLLFGATGSGKTEVYLQAIEALLERDPQAQALVLVPEINLTPQLEARLQERLGARFGPVLAMHSGLTPAQRLNVWLRAHLGLGRVLLGTRLAVMASLPALRLIVVDEEHDPSYKSQDGARYSARDLAIYRAAPTPGDADMPTRRVVLGSATPSLESWHASRVGRYLKADMPSRAGGGALPAVRLLDTRRLPKGQWLAPSLREAIGQRASRGEQTLLLLNRRGYAPVLSCAECAWASACPHCSAHRVFHKAARRLCCHHCGLSSPVPRACPDCGNPDIAPLGRGSEQLEEALQALLADLRRPDGTPLVIERMDADSMRPKGQLEAQLQRMHEGAVDVLVGTQMLAKGHDFRRVTLVASLDTDAALFAADYRAPERLFALLMQVAGRAGRDARHSAQAEVWVQTGQPQHPLFEALRRHDFPAFADQQLEERRAAGLPPHTRQALLRAEASTQQAAQALLRQVVEQAAALPEARGVTLYPPVPMSMSRVARVEHAQALLESPSRQALQGLLAVLPPLLQRARRQPVCRGLKRYAIDVDPLSI